MFCFRLDKISDGYKGSTKEINKEDCEESTEDSKTKQKNSEEKKDHPQILKYIKNQVDIGYLLVKIVKTCLNISVLLPQVLDLLLNLSTEGHLLYLTILSQTPQHISTIFMYRNPCLSRLFKKYQNCLIFFEPLYFA